MLRQTTTSNYKLFCSYAASLPQTSLDARHNIFLCQKHFSQSVSQSDVDHERRGSESYELALESLRNAASTKQSLEDKLMREQYEAMVRQMQMTNQDRAAGAAVVRTIVDQTRKAQTDVKVDKWDSKNIHDDNNLSANSEQLVDKQLDDDYFQKIAFRHLEEAALRYGHSLALVRLGNEALERAKKVSHSTYYPLINKERCTEWINESPINLSSILAQSPMKTKDKKEDDDSPSHYVLLAQALYEEAGKAGSADAWYNLGHLLWDRSHDDAAKLKAMDAFAKAVDLGDADAMYFLGAQYLSSQKDQEAGYQLLYRAGHQFNHGPALHHLALMSLEDGKNDEFRVLLTKAADAGNPDSLFLQGHCYYNGEDGYEVDVAAALSSFLVAAENFDHVDSMVSAGAILHQGCDSRSYTIKRDQRRAFELYQRAGELGSIEGWRNVVACYATGEGVKKDLDMARHIAKTMLKEDDR
jgi:TPR repeat protein